MNNERIIAILLEKIECLEGKETADLKIDEKINSIKSELENLSDDFVSKSELENLSSDVSSLEDRLEDKLNDKLDDRLEDRFCELDDLSSDVSSLNDRVEKLIKEELKFITFKIETIARKMNIQFSLPEEPKK